MATSSFTKNFVVAGGAKADVFLEKMENTPKHEMKGFKSRLVNLKDLKIKTNHTK
jgi:hypothetical protein